MRNFNFGVKNFRAFDSNGVNLEVAPITILTGCNSSGKSSFVKAIGLLDSFLQQIKSDLEKDRDIQLNKYVLNFKSNQNKILGDFSNVLNNKDLNEITFSYTIYSLILSCEVGVELTFVPKDKDELNNGSLKRLVISTDQGIIYSSEKDSDNQICNFNLFKDKAIEFIYLKSVINSYIRKASSYQLHEEDVSKEELIAAQTEFKQEYNTPRAKDILKYIRHNIFNANDKYFIGNNRVTIDKFFQTKSLFYIQIIDKYKNYTANDLTYALDQILSKISKDNFSNLKIALNKIIEDFSNSKHQTFGEYFLEKEVVFLENALQKQPNFPEPTLPTIHPLNTYIETSNLNNLDVVLTNQVSFELLYEIFMTLEVSINHSIGINDSQFYFEGHEEQSKFHHRLYTSLTMVLQEFLIECLTPSWCDSMQFASSGNVPQRRCYLLDENNAFTSSLNKYFKFYPESQLIENKKYDSVSEESFINKWLNKFKIADKINIKQDNEGLGVIKITLEKDGKTTLLADHGLGITYLVYCMLQIEAAILAAKGEKTTNFCGLSDLDGYNESKFHYEEQIVAIEEPESHLHPNFQSQLAEMFVDAYNEHKIHFIIETHSEYLIRKLQTLVAREEINNHIISISYFNNPYEIKPNQEHIKNIKIIANGYLSNQFGPGFFDEANNHSYELLRLKSLK